MMKTYLVEIVSEERWASTGETYVVCAKDAGSASKKAMQQYYKDYKANNLTSAKRERPYVSSVERRCWDVIA
jgi:hypothetical protein